MNNNKIRVEHFIGFKKECELPAIGLYTRFSEIYKNYFVSEEIPSTTYNYRIKRVDVQFRISTLQFSPELTSNYISCYGLEKNINDLLDEMRKKFNVV